MPKRHGVAQNFQEAAKWWRKAAEQNLPFAHYSLGVMYLTGQGVEKNNEKAVAWLRKAADQGFEPARAALKKMSQ